MSFQAMGAYDFETLLVSSPSPNVLHVQLNRPKKRNAMNMKFWEEFRVCFERIALDRDVRAVVVSGAGTMFSSGLDLSDSGDALNPDASDGARRAYLLRAKVMRMQDAFTAIEECPWPVIASVHGGCVGGGVDLAASCDIRHCSTDAFFSIKEVDVGLAADVGTLQRIGKIVGNDSVIRELAYTARRMEATEAHQIGFIGKVVGTAAETLAHSMAVAADIASKSPVAVVGSKRFLNHARTHSSREALEYAATWNMAMLNTDDVPEAFMATQEKRKGNFSKL